MPAMARAAAPAKAASRKDPRRDPRYQRVLARLDADSRRLKQHPTARQKAGEPAKAAKGPPNEKRAGAQARQVDRLDDAKAPKPETKSFLATLQAEIAKAMPKNLGDTEKFMKGGSAEAMKGSLQGNVAQQKDASTGDMKAASEATPDEAAAPVKPVTPIAPEAAASAPKVDGAEAMPLPKPEAEVSLQASKTEVQDQLNQERLSETRLKKANDPRFSSVLSAQGAVARQADNAPGQYRAKEAGVLGQAAAKAMDVARKGAGLLLGVKGGNKAKVQSRQEQQKAREELELKDFSDFVVKTFQAAKKAVDERLAALDAKVNALFDKGIEGALASMKDFVEGKLLRYKLQRYLGVPWGAALWLKDQFLDLPKEVDAFYEAGRKQFTNTMNALAVQVATLVEGQLAAAKKDVRNAQTQIAARQARLSPGVQARGAQLQAEFDDKFAELESGIEDKKQQLAEGLAQKYKEAFDKADESLKALQDENKGLVTKAKEKIGEVIKALKEFRERLLGVLKKGANAVQIILDDPIQFLKYLLSALKQGFNQFADNITTHLKAGFIKWMFGSLTKLGIEPPADLSPGQILKLVLGVLGITYARMREKAVKLLGPTAVTVIEKVAEYIQALIAGGPAALWEKVKEDLGNLKAMVIDAIQDWLITTIVKKAVAKVVSMFNPVGAIIQAVLLIVDVVSFVVEKAMQLLDFVEAVVNSLYDIATGAIGTAANWIEQALGRMVPILIGFLGQLLGLGGITEKIKEFIKKIQDKVDKAIDKVLKQAVGYVKGLFGKGKDGKPEAKPAPAQAQLEAAVQAAEKLADDNPSLDGASAQIAAIKAQFGLKRLELRRVSPTEVSIDAEINPKRHEKRKLNAKQRLKDCIKHGLHGKKVKIKGSGNPKRAAEQAEIKLRQLRAEQTKLAAKARSADIRLVALERLARARGVAEADIPAVTKRARDALASASAKLQGVEAGIAGIEHEERVAKAEKPNLRNVIVICENCENVIQELDMIKDKTVLEAKITVDAVKVDQVKREQEIARKLWGDVEVVLAVPAGPDVEKHVKAKFEAAGATPPTVRQF